MLLKAGWKDWLTNHAILLPFQAQALPPPPPPHTSLSVVFQLLFQGWRKSRVWKIQSRKGSLSDFSLKQHKLFVWMSEDYLFLIGSKVFSVKAGRSGQHEDKLVYTLSWRRLGKSGQDSCFLAGKIQKRYILWTVCFFLLHTTLRAKSGWETMTGPKSSTESTWRSGNLNPRLPSPSSTLDIPMALAIG